MLQRDDEDLAQIFHETGLDEGDRVWSSIFDPDSSADADGPTTSLSQLMREFSNIDENVGDAPRAVDICRRTRIANLRRTTTVPSCRWRSWSDASSAFASSGRAV